MYLFVVNKVDEIGLEVCDLLCRAHAMCTDALLCALNAARLIGSKHINEDLGRLLRCALVLVDDRKRLVLKARALRVVGEEAQRLRSQLRAVRDRHDGTAIAEKRMDVLEIEHLISDNDRLAVRRRLKDIVPAVRDKTAADVDHVTEPIDAAELTDRIEDHNVLAALRSFLEILARIDRKPGLAAEMLHLHRAQHLARRDDEAYMRILCTHSGKGVEHQLFLPAVGRARDHDAARPRQAELRDQCCALFGADTRIRLIELRIARHGDELTRCTEAHDIVRVDARLHRKAFHRPDHLAQHPEQVLVLLHAAVADAAVDHHDGHIELLRFLEEVRPQLRLHGQKDTRADASHDARGEERQVEWEIDDRVRVLDDAVRHLIATRRHDRDEDGRVGKHLAELTHERTRRHDLPNGCCMHPDGILSRHLVNRVLRIEPEALLDALDKAALPCGAQHEDRYDDGDDEDCR